MQNYKINIEEILVKEFNVPANSEDEAIETAMQKYYEGEFILDPGELVAKQMQISASDDAVTEWFEF